MMFVIHNTYPPLHLLKKIVNRYNPSLRVLTESDQVTLSNTSKDIPFP